jgi:predicted alpha/beta hydrolase
MQNMTSANYSSDNGGSLSFDGADEYVTFTSPSFAFGTGDFSIEGWAYVTSHKAWRALATTRPNTSGFADAWHIGCGAAGDIFLYSNTFNLRSAAGAVPVNTWFHWCCVRINSAASLLVNTVVVDSGTVTNNYTRTLLGIGDFPQAIAEQWSGYMSAFKVYNRALTGDEVRQNYEATVGRFT